ncbi:MAG: phytochelatin synthase family protein [Xanthobacteraceae bacterium]
MSKSLHSHPRMSVLIALLATLFGASRAGADDAKPRFGPNAVPIEQATGYLRTHRAPDYWAISPFYIAQDTDSACSAASIAILLNALRGLPPRADVDLVTQAGLRARLGDARWTAETAQDGSGVTFAEFVKVVTESLHAYGFANDEIQVFKPANASNESLARLQHLLGANEHSGKDIALLYFNQGVLTGDWDGPHISPIGAFDAHRGRVLIMDVDRRFYVPYWSPIQKVLESMLKPAPASFGPLAGETGGIVWVRPKQY